MQGKVGRVFFRQLASIVLGCLALLSLNPVANSVTAASPPPVVLTGHVLPRLASMRRIGAAPASQSLTLTIALRPASATGLAAAARARSAGGRATPDLSAADIGRAYGQPMTNVAAVGTFFADRGFAVLPIQPDRLSFQVRGTVDQVNQALAVRIGSYDDGVGHQFYSTDRDPTVPASIAGLVQAIIGLDNFPALHPLDQAAPGSPGSYAPADMRAAYNVNPLYSLGFNGNGQTIGIIGCDAFALSDIRSFESSFSLPTASITTVPIDTGPVADGQPETTLDLEWSGAIAPQAALVFYGFSTQKQCSFQGLFDALARASNDNQAGVISISLGACENAVGASIIDSLETQFAATAAKGQGVFVASGDSGAYACSNGAPGTPTVSYPGSSQYATAVGGTSLLLANNGGYGSESAWGASHGDCTGPCGSGGGISQFIGEPSWQSAANIPGVNGQRGVPDVSWNADPATGNVIFFKGSLQGGWGGTSIASPQWAGLAAIINQAMGERLGQLSPYLYGPRVTGAETSSVPPYHDVTTGSNLLYHAGPGWDLATGWGSPNAANLLLALQQALRATPTPTGTPTVTPTPSASPTVAPTIGPHRIDLPVIFNRASGGAAPLQVGPPTMTPTPTVAGP